MLLSDPWDKTLQNDHFLLHQCDRMIIFASDLNLQTLSTSEKIFMDGTFKSAPRIYDQLYTLHGLYKDHIVPLVYCLLTSKDRSTYFDMFTIIKREMADRNLVFSPRLIYSDFEAAMVPTIAA